ncbi:unnamed protein product, partial [Didymodactylos carnosus]
VNSILHSLSPPPLPSAATSCLIRVQVENLPPPAQNWIALDDELFKSIAAELHPNTSILWLKDIWQNNTNKTKFQILSEYERSEGLDKENDDVSSIITPVNKESSSTLEPCCL